MSSALAPAYEHNGKLVSAEAFYKIACDPRRSVAVEACAGAGKTWMLVSRILRALLDGVDAKDGALQVQPHEILAITFTKRAASEMRERLYKWLADFASADHATLVKELQDRGVSMENGSQPLSLLPEQLSKLYQSILACGRQVQVRTFHSWFASLLRSAPLAVLQQMELPANYELLEDDAPAKALVWRRFYEALVTEGEPYAGWRADFEAVVLAHGRAQTEKALQTALDKRTEFALADAHGVVEQSVQHFCDQYPDFAWLESPDDYLSAQPLRWQTLLDAAKALGGASAKTFAAKGVELETALTSGDIDAAFAALLTNTGSPRKFGEKIAGIERVREAQDLVLRVVAARLQHAAWTYQQRMARLTRVLLQEFAALKRECRWVDMNDVERAALVMLSDPVLAGWVQERLDARIKHLLIDEFQDTNPLQWQALRSWLSGYAGAGGRAPSVFIVGDPKQSIYRFRRAEPQVFKAAKAFVRDGLGGDLLSCDHTRRNATGVIATVNETMAQAVQDDGYEGFRAHTTSAVEAGRVCKLPPIARSARPETDTADENWRDSLTTPREVPEETLRTLEARQAAHWIARQLTQSHLHGQGAGLQAADVMVLSRKRAGLMPLKDELRKLHIAAQIGEKTDLIDCCEVQDVVALLDVLVSPQHDLSLARVLKSPVFGMTDEALVQLALQQRESKVPWFHLLQKTELMTQDQRGVSACLIRWKGWLDQLPPHDALQAIYFDGDLLARFAAVAPANQRDAVLANLTALLGVSLQLGGGRFATPYAFVRALKAGGVLAPAAVNPLAVRLLTIHGAKGLEAHTVLLLDTDTPERNADTMGVLVDWPGEDAWPQKFVFLASESTPPACAVPTLEAERLERQREELNALYVALTRARSTLAISSIEPYRTAERSWWQRLASKATDVAPAVQADEYLPALATESSAFYIKELPQALIKYFDDAIKNEAFEKPAELQVDEDSPTARIGKAMHRLLEWGETSATNIAAAAREFELTPEQGQQAAAMAQCILQGDGAWAWDPAVVGWQGNEVDLMVQGETLRLDRLVQRKDAAHAGQWWVLDYKSAHAPQEQPALIAQLSSYRAAVQTIYPGAVVKAAFLTGRGTVVAL
ncbi:exodeoxyribonuclease V subunit beta [Rhodoferax sp.]|uniref:UvrD-helicase domain-containing protein n=1 Tax=Rhodoferax sp. TaxID=50421 RepID=UPI001EB81985|nr:UvrD-helicase domain-containing protein [Rhodoferax sp.]MBT9506552.1 UvrD-helicase domain-containing protein [Rhodoferax sp.]